MPEQLELDLTQALADAGARASAPADLLALVERRAGLRRRRRTTVAIGAVAVLTLAVAAVPHFLPRSAGPTIAAPTVTPAPSATPAPVIDLGPLHFPAASSDLAEATEVWPQAVVDVPDSLGNPGGSYGAVGQLDADHVLVTWNDSFEHAVELYSYDVRGHTSKKLADLAGPAGAKDYFVQEFTANHTEIFWWATSYTNGGGPTETFVWGLPRTGGTPRLVGMVPTATKMGASDLSDMRADDDALYWSAMMGGVYRMPLYGDGVQELAGLEQFRIVAFPWASRLDSNAFETPDANTVMERDGVATVLRNVVTGEEIQVHAPSDATSLWCVPMFCVGEAAGQQFAMRPDGSHRTGLGGIAYSKDSVIDGRYALGQIDNAMYIVDVQTWKIGKVDAAGVGSQSGAAFWTRPGGTGMFMTAAIS
jgi:hypothetical protein